MTPEKTRNGKESAFSIPEKFPVIFSPIIFPGAVVSTSSSLSEWTPPWTFLLFIHGEDPRSRRHIHVVTKVRYERQ